MKLEKPGCLPIPVLRGRAADLLLEDRTEIALGLIADPVGNDFDRQVGVLQEALGVLDPLLEHLLLVRHAEAFFHNAVQLPDAHVQETCEVACSRVEIVIVFEKILDDQVPLLIEDPLRDAVFGLLLGGHVTDDVDEKLGEQRLCPGVITDLLVLKLVLDLGEQAVIVVDVLCDEKIDMFQDVGDPQVLFGWEKILLDIGKFAFHTERVLADGVLGVELLLVIDARGDDVVAIRSDAEFFVFDLDRAGPLDDEMDFISGMVVLLGIKPAVQLGETPVQNDGEQRGSDPRLDVLFGDCCLVGMVFIPQ